MIVYVAYAVLFVMGQIPSHLTAQNQVWPKQGATWIYSYQFIQEGIVKYYYEKDTVFQGKTCQKIKSIAKSKIMDQFGNYHYSTNSNGEYFFYSLNDSVFFFDHQRNQFEFAFDFSVKTNDKWNRDLSNVTTGCTENDEVLIQKVSDTLINGKTIRMIQLMDSGQSNYYKQSGFVLGRIGNYYAANEVAGVFYPIGWKCGVPDDRNSYDLLTYSDNEWSFSPKGVDGEKEFNQLSLNSLVQSSWNVFPNPGNEKVSIEHQGQISTISVFNSIGIEVVVPMIKVNPTRFELDMTAVPNGTYFITDKETGSVTQWIKMK